jgi:hypothetical protein
MMARIALLSMACAVGAFAPAPRISAARVATRVSSPRPLVRRFISLRSHPSPAHTTRG